MQERRLAEIPAEDWNDVRVDITPREYVLDYLAHGFPVQLYEPFGDSSGNLFSRPVYRDGNPVECREAVRRREQLIEHLAALPPVPGALDQVIHHFGTERVAEVTGRSRRIVAKRQGGEVRFAVENRPGSAGLAEEQAFMEDRKSVLVFSEAGGTGRSYHADLAVRNQRPRIHYLLEAGWRADVAIQGIPDQPHQPGAAAALPIGDTDVKAQKRFISTIARRLDTLGAMTRGQRQTGGQNMFRPEDNLESDYARDALRQLYVLLVGGRIGGCSLLRFEQATGLRLTSKDTGGMLDELPPITTFLNRMLALTIELQNVVFAAFEGLLARRIEGAIAAGVYEIGLETLQAESFVVTDRREIYTHPGTGAKTALLTIARKDRNRPYPFERALERARDSGAVLLVNGRSGRAAVQVRERSVMHDDGEIERRVRLIRPMESLTLALDALSETHWARRGVHGCPAWLSSRVSLGRVRSQLPGLVTTRIRLQSLAQELVSRLGRGSRI